MGKEKQKGRIVIKVGSNVLTRADGKLNITRMSAIVDQIATLRRDGYEIILVSSGSVASGKGILKVNKDLGSVEQRQLYSAVGQAKLISLYYTLFREQRFHIGQVLTMKESFATRREYLNQRACMEVMLSNGVIPIINENDTISVTELMFTDNDELSGLVASILNADTLIILSNVDGIYQDVQKKNIISSVRFDDDLSQYIQSSKSSFGRGGMMTKCSIAQKAAEEGIRVIIANGNKDNILLDLINNPEQTPHTTFEPNQDGVSNVKKWIAHSDGFAKGEVIINKAAQAAIAGKEANSLLLVGVVRVEGDFEEGDIIHIYNEEGDKIGLGKTAYSSQDARASIGKHNLKPLIRYEYLYIE